MGDVVPAAELLARLYFGYVRLLRLLQIVRRGKHGPGRVRRAMIIMASAPGTLVPAIARLVAADEGTVRDALPRRVPGAAHTAGPAARGLSPHPRHRLLPWLLLRGR